MHSRGYVSSHCKHTNSSGAQGGLQPLGVPLEVVQGTVSLLEALYGLPDRVQPMPEPGHGDPLGARLRCHIRARRLLAQAQRRSREAN